MENLPSLSRETLKEKLVFTSNNCNHFTSRNKMVVKYKSDILYLTKSFNKFKPRLIERIYAIINDIHDRPKCKECGNYVNYYNKGCYSPGGFCSHKCSQINKEINEKRRITQIEAMGKRSSEEKQIAVDKQKETMSKKSSEELADYSKKLSKASRNGRNLIKKYQGTKGKEQGHIYLLRIWNREEVGFKVGVSCVLQNRMKTHIKKCPYNVELVDSKTMSNLETVKLEQYLLEKYKDIRWFPKLKFGGHTECLLERIELRY